MGFRCAVLAVSALAAARAAVGAEAPLAMEDPAPPAVHAPPADLPTPRARPHPRVIVHGAPRPLPAGFAASDWPAFYGPTYDFVSPETNLQVGLGGAPRGRNDPQPLWEMRKGDGYSAPAVAGRRLVAFHRLGDREVVECLDAEAGGLLWTADCPTTYRDRFGYNSGPRASPVIAAGRVYTYGAQAKLQCLDLGTGHLYWRRDLAGEFGANEGFFGVATTPLVDGGLVIVNVGAKGGPCVAAFDAATGRLRWGSGRQWGAGYASPIPATLHGKRVVFVFAGGYSRPPTGGLLCLDPAGGAIHWRLPWRSRRVASVNASSPVVVGDRVMISSIYDVGAVLLQVKPDLTRQTVWTSKRYASHWMMPIVRGGYVYGFAEDLLICLDWRTGGQVWRSKVTWPAPPAAKADPPATVGIGRGSLLWADGRFLCLGETGWLCWLDLTPKGMNILARARLFRARQTWTAPVLIRGLLYVMQNAPDAFAQTPPRLLCYDLRPPRPSATTRRAVVEGIAPAR